MKYLMIIALMDASPMTRPYVVPQILEYVSIEECEAAIVRVGELFLEQKTLMFSEKRRLLEGSAAVLPRVVGGTCKKM